MGRIVKHLKNNYKIIIGVVISGCGVYAATVIASSNVEYSNTTSGLSATTVQGAIDEIYEKSKTHCPEGYKCEKLPTYYYYAFGTPTTSSTTDFTTLGKNVFARLGSDGSYGVCINDGGLFCIQTNDYDNSVAAIKEHFGESSCTDYGTAVDCK